MQLLVHFLLGVFITKYIEIHFLHAFFNAICMIIIIQKFACSDKIMYLCTRTFIMCKQKKMNV